MINLRKLKPKFRLQKPADFKVGAKLAGGFAVIIVIVVVIAALGYFNMKSLNDSLNSMYSDGLTPVQLCGNLNTAIYQVRGNLYRYLAVPGERDQAEADINEKAGQIDHMLTELSAANNTDLEQQRLTDVNTDWLDFSRTTYDVMTQVKVGNTIVAMANLLSAGTSCIAMDKATLALSEEYKNNAVALHNQGKAVFASNVIMAVVLSLIAIAVSLLLAIVLTRSITRPLLKGVGMMKELSVGHFGRRLKMNRRDEIGVLAESMDMFADDLQSNVVGTMKKIAAGDLTTEVTLKDGEDEISPALKDTIDSLRALMADMKKVYREQKAGDMDYYASIDKYQGAYKEVLEAYNAAVKMHVDNMLKILGILTSYSEGDFVPVLAKLPGKQAVANEKMDMLRENLLSLIVETEMLTRGAAEGQLDVRGDVDKFKGDYKKILQGINNTLDNIVVPLNESLEVLAKEAENDLTKHVTGEYHGELSKLKNAINASTDTRINVVLKLKQVTQHLLESSARLSQASDQASQATQQIAMSSQQVAKGASDQASALQDTLKAIAQLSNAIDQIAKGAQEQAQMIEKNVQMVNNVSTAITAVSANAQNASAGARVAAESAQKGAAMSRETVKGMETIKKTMDAASAKMNGLGERSKGDRQDRSGDRRYSGPDQSACLECCDRSSQGRRPGARLRCGGG